MLLLWKLITVEQVDEKVVRMCLMFLFIICFFFFGHETTEHTLLPTCCRQSTETLYCKTLLTRFILHSFTLRTFKRFRCLFIIVRYKSRFLFDSKQNSKLSAKRYSRTLLAYLLVFERWGRDRIFFSEKSRKRWFRKPKYVCGGMPFNRFPKK
jgi:hypothetical protein